MTTLPDFVKALQKEHVLVQDQAALLYSSQYLTIEAELEKQYSLYGEKPDFDLVLENGLHFIEAGGGHFKVMRAVVFAMLEKWAWPGFVESVNFVAKTLDQHWENLYPLPLRMKGRLEVLNSLMERYLRYLEGHPVQSLGMDFLNRLQAALQALNASLQKTCGNEISVMALLRPIESAEARIKAEQSSKEIQQKQEEQRRAEALNTTLEDNAEPISVSDYLESLTTAELYQVVAARMMEEKRPLLEADPFEWALYKHHRGLLWWSYPWSSQELLQQIDDAGFDWEAYTAALELQMKQEHLKALLAFEALFEKHPFALDLQYHICDCLEDLGAEASLIALLKGEVVQLCTRYPELLTAKIKGEIPVLGKGAKRELGLQSL